jgi:hypothetical protein
LHCIAANGGVVSWRGAPLLQTLCVLADPAPSGLRRGTAEFDALADELLRAACLQFSLRHANIVLLHGVTMHPEHDHVQWLVTEHADGGSLESWLAVRGRMTLEELLDLLRSIMRALVYLHSRVPAALHGDITPASVLVFTSFGGGITWKLADVGIAKVLKSQARASRDALAGMPFYTAPDVGPHDGRADVFSTGIMAAELVVRHMDIAGFERAPASKYQYPGQRADLVDDACARLDTMSPALASVLRGCSAMMPKHRMTSAAALHALQELEVVVVGGGGAAAAAAAATGAGSGAPAPPLTMPGDVDMSAADAAMGELGVEKRASDRVCDAMVLAADAHGKLSGARFLQMVVDEGVTPSTAMKLRQRLGITAGVPPRSVRTGVLPVYPALVDTGRWCVCAVLRVMHAMQAASASAGASVAPVSAACPTLASNGDVRRRRLGVHAVWVTRRPLRRCTLPVRAKHDPACQA